MWNVNRVVITIALALSLSACAARSGSAADADDVGQPLKTLPSDTRWQLADSSRGALQLPEASRVTMHIDEARLYGDSGCNRYSAEYRIDDDGKVDIDPVASTKRGCIGPAGDVEKAFYEALQDVRSFSLEDEMLVLKLGAGDALRFRSAPPEAM